MGQGLGQGLGQRLGQGKGLLGQPSLQQQLQMAQAKQEEERKRVAHQKQAEDLRRRQEEQKRALEEQKRQEERRRLEEQRKIAEQKRQQEEQKAVMQIRRVLQKFRMVTPENIVSIQQELAEVRQKELPSCGSHTLKLAEEVNKTLEDAKHKVATINAERVKEEQRKQEQAKQHKEATDKSASLVQALNGLVEELEAAAKVLDEAAEPLSQKITLEQIESTTAAINSAADVVLEKHKVCNDFMQANSAAIKVPDIPGQAPSDKSVLPVLQGRVGACLRKKEQQVKKASDMKSKELKKIEAEKKLKTIKDSFMVHNKSKSGQLNKEEAKAFAKAKFSFTPTAAALDAIWAMLVEQGEKGVSEGKFHRLKVALGIALDREKDQQRKAKREAREKQLADTKADLAAKVEVLKKVAEKAEELGSKAEERVKLLNAQVNSVAASWNKAECTPADIRQGSDDVESLCQATKAVVTEGRESLTALKEGVPTELLVWLTGEVRSASAQLDKTFIAVDRGMTFHMIKARDVAAKKDAADLTALLERVVEMIKHHGSVKDLYGEQLVAAIHGDAESISEAAWLSFFETCEKKEVKEGEEPSQALTEEELKRAYQALDDEGEGTVSSESLLSLTRMYMKVVKDIVVSAEIEIASDAKRKLEFGEVVEVMSKTTQLEEGLLRVKVKAIKDGVEGWSTVSGNQGTLYMKDCKGVMKVARQSPLTGSFELHEADSEEGKAEAAKLKGRQLKVGELVEVRQWPKKHEPSGLMRMKCKAKSDGVIGWVSSSGPLGSFLQVV